MGEWESNGIIFVRTWGFPARHGGTPINGWIIRENPNLKWMKTGGIPILGYLHSILLVLSREWGNGIIVKNRCGLDHSAIPYV